MLIIEIKRQAISLLDNLLMNGPKWKKEHDIQHLEKRRKRRRIPLDWGLYEYNLFIVELAKDTGNETYLYYKNTFQQRYFVVGDGYWIFIIGENEVIETAYPPNDYKNYLSEKEGFTFLGTIKEVRCCEL